MTKLADELEALAKDATPGKWPDALAGSVGSSAHMANFDLCNLMCSSDNLATIIAALRQPDAVPGDLVERPTIYMDVEELRTWSSHFKPGSREHGCIIRAADELESGRTAIQSLTAERDAALARVAELGRIYQALVNLQDHARGAEQIFKTRLGARTKPTWFAISSLQDFVGFVGMWEECNQARALLEGSKP